MKKLTPQEQSGTEYIQLSRLPVKQIIPFTNWICETDKFTMIDEFGEKYVCVYYDKYEFWLDTYEEEKEVTEFSLF